MIYNKKLAVATGAIAIVLCGLIVFLVYGGIHLNGADEVDETTKSTEVTKRSTTKNNETETSTSDETKKQVPVTTVNAISKDGQYVVLDGDDIDVFLTGLATATINGKTRLYYFNEGVYDDSYTGIALLTNATLGGANQSYYVVKGVAQTDYTGTYSDTYTTYNIENGIVQE